MRRLSLLVVACLLSLAAIPAHAQFTQQGPKLVGTGAVGSGVVQGVGVALSADGNTAAVGGSGDNGGVGAVWVQVRSGGVWAQQGSKLTGTGGVGFSAQGYSVALSADGNTLIEGARGDNGTVGAAWVFTRSGGVWTQQGGKLVGTGNVGGSLQGYSVALSADGNTALIGAQADNNGAGAAWVFTRSGGTWTQQGGKLVGSDPTGPSQLGTSVALSADGNTALVGGYYDNTGEGAAWVFTRSGGAWTQQGAKLIATPTIGVVAQGDAVDLSADGNTAIIGAELDNSSIGGAFVFVRSGGSWSQQGGKLVGSSAVGAAQQGQSVAISADGNTAMVGGGQDNGGTGAVWVYTRSAGAWHQLASKLTAGGSTGAPNLGVSVATSADGNTLIAGGFGDNSAKGAAWVFVNPVAENCRFASSVVSFSSEYSTTDWSAQQALGPPNIYPKYGDLSFAWASATPDGQQEFLDLGFATPARINFVNVYETQSPGAIKTVSVRNPYSGAFEVVWSGTAAPAPDVPRVFTATFPTTPYPVSEVRIDVDSPAVPYYNEIDAVGIGYRDLTAASEWASGVIGFSSQYSTGAWSAQQALGPPDLYPNYGDDGRAWASLTPDDQQELIDLTYSTPVPISFVSVYETFAPGALERVSVVNPNTSNYEVVWSGAASPAPPLARINTVSFPETPYRVSEVKLEFDSPAVPDWNEVDAVGIGRCACQASAVDVPAPAGVRTRDAMEAARPNPFRVSTGMAFSLSRAGHVRVDVYDVLGGRVTSVLDGTLPAGRHEAHWNGRDANGRAAASGIYYVRVASPSLNGARKIVKVE